MCNCKCCATGAPCAHALLLSPKDSSDATRLWARFAENGPGIVNLKVTPAEQRASLDKAEPTESMRCRSCGALYALFAYLVAFLREQRAPIPDCQACGARRAA